VVARSAGKAFQGWSDGDSSPERLIVPGPEGVDLSARFR
jgi:hypothetical protein